MFSVSTFKSQKRSTFLKFCIAIAILTISGATASAATYTVTNTADSGPGSLRQAITDANSSADNDTIEFALSGCPCVITLTTGELSITNNSTLTINGLGADQLSVSGNNTSRVFFIGSGATSTIDGINVTGGNGVGTSSGGGGIYNGGTLTLTNSIVSNNRAAPATTGGGINNRQGGTLTLISSAVADNVAYAGGGIENSGGTVTVFDSTVYGNSTSNSHGGGLANTFAGTLTMNNSTVSNNSAAVAGGGVYSNNGGTLTVTNSTISNNTAILVGGIFVLQSTLTLTNSIIANSTIGDCATYQVINVNASYSLVQDGGCDIMNAGVGNLTGDPNLGELADNGGPTLTHALMPSSLAIDAGDPNYAGPLTTDQRGTGFARVVNGRIDIGAFEVQTVICPHPQGYWKNDPDAWPVDELEIGGKTYPKAEVLSILNTPIGTGRNADASLILARQLIAAKLNIANGADASSVAETIEAADALLSQYEGRLPLRVRSSSTNGQQMVDFGGTLDTFNNGDGCTP